MTVVVAFLVFGTLQQPELPTFPPSTVAPADVGNALVGPLTYTVDAREETGWRYFDFSVGAEVFEPGPTEWDLAFRRFNIIANGGAGFFGSAGIRDLGPVSFDSLVAVPLDGYTVTTAGRDSVNAAIGRWYSYSWSSHVLTPKAHVYAVRTADGRYAKMQIVSYYCPGALPGCVSIRYAYQGDGSTRTRSGEAGVEPPVPQSRSPGP